LKRSLAALNLFTGRDEQNPEYMLVILQRERFTRKWLVIADRNKREQL